MARPEWRDLAKERFWRRTVAAWQRSGLTIRDYCDVHALAEHNFHAWRRELLRRDQERGERRAQRQTTTGAAAPEQDGDPAKRAPSDHFVDHFLCSRARA